MSWWLRQTIIDYLIIDCNFVNDHHVINLVSIIIVELCVLWIDFKNQFSSNFSLLSFLLSSVDILIDNEFLKTSELIFALKQWITWFKSLWNAEAILVLIKDDYNYYVQQGTKAICRSYNCMWPRESSIRQPIAVSPWCWTNLSRRQKKTKEFPIKHTRKGNVLVFK